MTIEKGNISNSSVLFVYLPIKNKMQMMVCFLNKQKTNISIYVLDTTDQSDPQLPSDDVDYKVRIIFIENIFTINLHLI
jgi:hypothetical protein